eukprot:6668914-Alexandrium_andersonii.AAC.1
MIISCSQTTGIIRTSAGAWRTAGGAPITSAAPAAPRPSLLAPSATIGKSRTRCFLLSGHGCSTDGK